MHAYILKTVHDFICTYRDTQNKFKERGREGVRLAVRDNDERVREEAERSLPHYGLAYRGSSDRTSGP